ncbi:2-amino-4-hydroxy-6-hydroxymethyldihydropteridine diphosphokinase [bacterium]|nr:2-amino-4-hydroxy-6-hydroxymethyldihydropteridine diphosphokinase [bacterium]
MAIVYLSLGSNKGDRIGYIQQATSLLSTFEDVEVIRTSSFYETEPWNMPNNTVWFVNAVLEIKTGMPPRKLLELCNRIENQLGRVRNNETLYEDRTIDIDILFYGKEIIEEKDFVIPHKFVHLRAFNLVPMLELNQNFIHPVLHKSIEEMHENLENPEMVVLYGTRKII